MKSYNEEVGNRIYTVRTEKDITLKELGDLVGLSESTVQRYEKGKIKNVDIDTVKKFADALKVSPGYLMGWEETKLSEKTLEVLKEFDNVIDNKKPTREEAAVAANILLGKRNMDLKSVPEEHHDNIISLVDLYKTIDGLEPEERTKLMKYISKTESKQESKITPLPKKEETPEHLILNAARPLKGATEEDRKHDDDIMDDPNF